MPRDPLLDFAELRILCKPELVLRIIVSSQVGQDGGTLHDCEVALVMVDNDRDTTIGSEFGKPWLLLDVLHDVD